jgi:carbohydrate binding protein with CBM4/9 domain
MKTTLIFPNSVRCLILLTLFTACTASPAPAAENRAPNPSFEMGEKSVVSGWEGNHSPKTFTWSEEVAYSGKHSVCISNLPADTSADWLTSEFIPVTPGTSYTLSAYIKGDFDREVYIMVFPIDAHGNYMEGSSTDISFNNTDWTYAEVDFTAPSDAVAVELDLGTNNASDTAATGMICYDEVSFR